MLPRLRYRDIAWPGRNEILKFEIAGAIASNFSKAVTQILEVNGWSRPRPDFGAKNIPVLDLVKIRYTFPYEMPAGLGPSLQA